MPELNLLIQNGAVIYKPSVKEGITLETERQGAPGKLCFSVLKDPDLNFQEGNPVALHVDNKNIFYGFVFTKKRNKDGLIDVTAYDQLRYLKNKTWIQYRGKKASEIIKLLAKENQLEVGTIADTGYVIPAQNEDGQTLFDIFKKALEETMQNTKEMYVLYDDFKKLTLKHINEMKLDVLINQNAAENFDYTSSIDSGTYNQIRLVYDNQKTGKPELYPADSDESIKRWGMLQYYEKLNNSENGPTKAKALLELYNRKTRNLSVSKAFGDMRVRGGTLLPVTLDLGDVVANTYMIVEKVKHTLSGDGHFMDLNLIGGDFNA